MTGWIVLIVPGVIALYAIVVFNRLVRLRNLAREGWSGIDVQIKRRERFLPYAIALDVENRWAKRFASVLAVAGTSATVGTWYAGSHNMQGDPVGFANHLGGSLTSTISSASSPPGSTGGGGGSGGGGSSGGGGGGGGGGW